MIKANPTVWPPADDFPTTWYEEHMNVSPNTPYSIIEVFRTSYMCSLAILTMLSSKAVHLTLQEVGVSKSALLLPTTSLLEYSTRITSQLALPCLASTW